MQALRQPLQHLPLPSLQRTSSSWSQGAAIAELRLQAASQSAALAQYQADYPALVGSLITDAIAVQVTPHLELLRDTCEELSTTVEGNNLSANSQLIDIMAYLKANLGGVFPPSASSSSSSASRSFRAQVSKMDTLPPDFPMSEEDE